ncbi:MAG: stage V sporulation protein AD [Clostridia bacterium]|nr:stage V sporulation protein AD [Clostridia bacterium]
MGIIKLNNRVCVSTVAAVCGKKEYDGAFGELYDEHSDDDTFGAPTFEQAEEEMQRRCFVRALKKGGFSVTDIDAVFAGDLMNQCTASSYGLLDYGRQYFGLFGACSTMAEALLLSSLCVDGGYFSRCAAIVSSHNCTAERQFRMPVEYGGQRTPTAQWTVTGSGCALIDTGSSGMYIKEVLPGIPVDRGVNDASNMGAAMAPAAADTLKRYFSESGKSPHDFDVILTGDLGDEGHGLTTELLSYEGFAVKENYLDCGMLLYKPEQDVHSGGSGCGCSALGLAVYLYEKFRKKEIKNALFIGTGALMSPMSVAQGHSIPGIAHLIRFSSEV